MRRRLDIGINVAQRSKTIAALHQPPTSDI
jgi:hypothetical protein